MRFTAMVLLLTAWMNAPATATIIHVPSEQPTIQAAIDAASAGDTVLVAPGTYAGPGNRDLSFGGTDLVPAQTYLEEPLRSTLHLILSLPDYQLG